MKSFSAILFSLTLATSALAHGFVSQMSIDGTIYKGDTPAGADNPSIIRQINTTSPVKGATNPDLNCGPGAGPAADVGSAMPGSKILFTWEDTTGGNWPHNTGPIMTYMASCGSTTCDKFDSQTAQWFKIDELGYEPATGTSGTNTWVQAEVMNGTPVNVTLPNTLAPGNYMIRHEIIALQLAVSLGGAEFYPSCSQITVGGSQTGAPTASELVSFPGAYSDNDPGIFDANVYNPGATYTFPGPPVAAFVTGSSGSSGSATIAATGTASAPTSTSTSSSGTCKLKKASSSSSAALAARTVRPRHLSRVMRGLIAGRSS